MLLGCHGAYNELVERRRIYEKHEWSVRTRYVWIRRIAILGCWRSLTGGLHSSGNAGVHRDALYDWSWRYPFFLLLTSMYL